jgi:hypothetical protein
VTRKREETARGKKKRQREDGRKKKEEGRIRGRGTRKR